MTIATSPYVKTILALAGALIAFGIANAAAFGPTYAAAVISIGTILGYFVSQLIIDVTPVVVPVVTITVPAGQPIPQTLSPETQAAVEKATEEYKLEQAKAQSP
jgi:hypothetical protein